MTAEVGWRTNSSAAWAPPVTAAGLQAQVQGGLAQRPPPHAVCPGLFRARCVGDGVVAQFGKVFHRSAGAAGNVGDDAGNVADRAVQDDSWSLFGDHPDRRIRHDGGGQDDALDHGDSTLECLTLQRTGSGCVGQQHGEVRFRKG